MLIPIGVDLQLKRHPSVTYILVGLNLLIYAIQWSLDRSGGPESSNEYVQSLARLLDQGKLSGTSFHFYSLITYQFLHASWWHVLGNMIFLLPFGKAVEDRMGHFGFAALYLGCGAIGGGLHALTSVNPVIGASGSVCAITASFIVLAPRTRIKILLIFFIIGIYQIPSLLFVMFFILFDTFSLLASLVGNSGGTTAWLVHLGGYVSGFCITFGLLQFGVIVSTQYDLKSMLRQFKRRKSYRKVIAQIPTQWNTPDQEVTPTLLLIATITQTAASGDSLAAAKQYIGALETNPSLKLDPRTMRLLGNVLLQNGKIKEGVQVFENYLLQQKNAKDRGEIALLLAAKYTRNLDNKRRAKELLESFASEFNANHQSLVDAIAFEIDQE